MPKGLERGLEKREGKIEIAKSALLTELFAIQKSTEGQHEYEVERRYKPAHLLSEAELLEKSKGYFRDIKQAYIFASTADGKEKTVRLRRTSPESEGILLRVAHKAKVKQNPAARDEYQIQLTETDPRAEEFEKLWKQHRWEVLDKKRFYIPHTIERTLPDGTREDIECEIHYDVHHGGRLDGFVRIEVEFRSDDDEKYVRDWKGQGSLLPDWIWEDVTNDKRYGSKALCRDGKPEVVD